LCLDKKLLNALLFIDFKKAFDMVDRDLLIYKLLNYGFDDLAIKIIINYFNGRSQVVKIDDILSNLADLLLEIVQGSCLGPLFFIIYTNDLPRFLKDILSKLFADDTTLIFSGNTLNVVNERMKVGIMQLNEWCKHNINCTTLIGIKLLLCLLREL
jgi:ribonucleases P/MRP protein subunit RPP40